MSRVIGTPGVDARKAVDAMKRLNPEWVWETHARSDAGPQRGYESVSFEKETDDGLIRGSIHIPWGLINHADVRLELYPEPDRIDGRVVAAGPCVTVFSLRVEHGAFTRGEQLGTVLDYVGSIKLAIRSKRD